MTIQEIKNTPEIVDFMLDKSIIADSRIKLYKRLEEICELAIKALEQTELNRKTGKWHLLDECANEGWYCDQCHKKVFKADFSNTMRKYKFCPNCGAKMEVN